MTQKTCSTNIPANGLMGWWAFNGNANDLSGYEHNGTVNGASLTTDRFGYANSAFYCPLSCYIEVPNFPVTYSEISVSGWYKTSAGARILQHDFNSPNGTFLIHLPGLPSTQGMFCLPGNTSHITMTSQTPTGDNQWHHVVIAKSSSSISAKMYIDGILVSTYSSPFNLNNGVASLYFGNPETVANMFSGGVDDVRIYNRALTQCEVTALFNETYLTPTTQASNVIFSNVLTNHVSFNWTDGNGLKRVVFIKQDSVGSAVPANNTTYTANTGFGSGSQIGTSGWYCVFNGTTHTSGVTVTNLLPNTNYRVMVCEYNGVPGLEQYNTSIAIDNPKTQKTNSSSDCGSFFTINHVVGSVAPVTKTVTYGTVTNIPGELSKCWITSNLGSDHQATTVNDATEASAGWYWQFNRMQGYKHDGTTRTPNTVWINPIDENLDWLAFNDPCTIELGGDWHIPTYTEWCNVDASGSWTNWNGPWNSGLKLHAAGYLHDNDGTLGWRGSLGHYRSNKQGSAGGDWSRHFGIDYSGMFNSPKAYGFTLRCLRDDSNTSPTFQSTNVTFSNITTNLFTFNWTDGNGLKRVVFIKQDSVGTAVPANNTTYTANTGFGSGSQIGTSGWYCVFNGTTHTSGVTVTNLLPTTNYRVMICEYNGIVGTEQYNTSTETNNPMNLITQGNYCPGIPTVLYSGKIYNTVQIGTQCWMKENLNIGTRVNGSVNQTNNSTIEKYCYNNLESNCDIYGGLYQWDEMMQYVTVEGVKGICPIGWHIPKDSEWTVLTTFLGGESIAGGKMKEIGLSHWEGVNVGASNSSGFTALGSGNKDTGSTFHSLNQCTSIWSSTQVYTTALFRRLFNTTEGVQVAALELVQGFSVRCLKDTCSTYSNTGISITPSANPVCSNTAVTFTATPVNGGTNPVYQWKVNGNNVSVNNSTYSYIPANNDAITCVLTSNAQCISGNTATSNTVTMIVNPPVPVSILIFTSGNYLCSGTNVTFMANAINGGSAPVYQWKVNGINVGVNNQIFSYVPINNDVVTCVLTSNVACGSGNPANSNSITMTVIPSLPVSVAINASSNPVCNDAPVTFTALPTNGGSNPVYQWKVNGVNSGLNSSTFSYSPANGDIITCILTSDVNCASGNPAISNQIVMSSFVLIPTITGTTAACLGGSAVTYTTESNMIGYNWIVSEGGQIVSGSNTNTVNVVWNESGSQTISVSYGNEAGCVAPSPTLINVIVHSTPEPAGVISGPTAVCVGTQGVAYFVDPILNATNYFWTVPFGTTIVTGAGSNSITVNFSNSTFIGDISVRGTNLCFSGNQSPNLTVTANGLLTGQVILTNITIPPAHQECLAAQSITTAGSGSTFLIEGGGDVTLIASEFVRFLPGTIVQENGFLHAFITNQCIPCSSLKIPKSDSNLLIASQTGSMTTYHHEQPLITVYPNPTSGSFTLEIEGENGLEKVRVEIYSLQGEKLLTEELLNERRHVFSLSDRSVGVYFIRVVTELNVETIKVVRH